MPVKLLYFAWVREKIGKAEEIVDLPTGVKTVADLVVWLRERGPEYAEAFARPGIVRAAIDKKHVPPASAVPGMTFSADPARNQPTLKTAACIGSVRRLTSDCSATTAWDRASMGSCARCG